MSDADELDKKLRQLAEIDMKRAVGEVIQIVRLAATLNCPIDTGELQQDIAADVEGDSIRAIGTCWTNKAYAPYVEFGTGPKGQADHAGISPDVTPVYTQSPWWIHESQVIAGQLRSTDGFISILQKDASISVQDSRHIPSCIRHCMTMRIRS